MSLKEKMLLFNKPKIDEKEHMIQQRKKASFNSKCAKFEGGKEPILVKQDSITKLKAKIFENQEEPEPLSLEEENNRKESFKKAKEAFQENKENGDATDEVDTDNSIENSSLEKEDCISEESEEDQKQQRKAEFEAKQKMFNCS